MKKKREGDKAIQFTPIPSSSVPPNDVPLNGFLVKSEEKELQRITEKNKLKIK